MSKKGEPVGTYKSLIVALLGVLFGVAGFFFVTIKGGTEFRTALAEFFAIIFGVSAVHFSYDLFIRRTWLKETQENVIVAVKSQWYRTSSLHKLGLERGFERLEGNKIRNMLAGADKVRVLKTWFPEDDAIEDGLKRALAGKKPVHLYLCDPFSKILEKRCESTQHQTFAGAQRKIYDAVKLVRASRFAEPNPRQNASVTLYDCWPGAPIIQCGPRFFVGFYFSCNISPRNPWLEVKEKSVFGELVRQQFESITEAKLCTLDDWQKLSDWMTQYEERVRNQGAITKK